MSIGGLWRVLAAIGAALGIVSGAAAATLNESDLAGGRFGGQFGQPTEVGAGFDTIVGTGNQNVYDNFVFTGLRSGGQSLAFRFWAPEGYDYSYSAGVTILYADQPFRWDWDGTRAGIVQVGYWQPSQAFQLDLGDSFSGRLYLALNFTHGSDLRYTISAPSNAGTTAPVPLPASALLIGAGVAALGAVRLRRRAA